jgi:thioredoxin-related protein
MQRVFAILILACANLTAWGQPEWLTDAQAALDKAGRENKFVLLDFTGSDWCGWCMKLKAEVFDKPEFAEFASANLVLVEVDFPHHKVLDQSQKDANERLLNAFHITSFPTTILLGPDGKWLGAGGYVSGGPQAFNSIIARIIQATKSSSQASGGAPQPPDDKPEAPRPPPKFVPIPPTVPLHYGELTLKGISGTKDRRLALINNQTFMAGETARVKALDHEVVVHCKEIRDNSVLITADDRPMELKLKNN